MQKKFILFITHLGFLASCMTTATNTATIQTTPITFVADIPSEFLTPTPKEIALPTLTMPVSATETQALPASPTLDIVTPTDSPFLEVHQQCLEVREDFDSNMMTDGKLIFISSIYFTDDIHGPETGNGVGLLTSQGMQAYPQFRFRDSRGFAISRDHKYIAYVKEDNSKLVVLNVKGEEVVSVPWLDEWARTEHYGGVLPRWLGNDRVFFSADVDNPGSVNVLNPFTGTVEKIMVAFPNIFIPDFSPTENINMDVLLIFDSWGDPNFAEFNTTYTRAVYLEHVSDELSLVLWDLELNKQIQRWPFAEEMLISRPVWGPDNTSLIAALPVAFGSPNFYSGSYYELFNITQDGVSQQLTNFKEAYPTYAIILGNMVWSPDGRYLAFNLMFEQEGENKTRFMLYVPAENKILDYCIIGDDELSVPTQAYWSPDSQQLIVSTARYSDNRSLLLDILLVDPAKGYIVKIGESWGIVGWMADDE